MNYFKAAEKVVISVSEHDMTDGNPKLRQDLSTSLKLMKTPAAIQLNFTDINKAHPSAINTLAAFLQRIDKKRTRVSILCNPFLGHTLSALGIARGTELAVKGEPDGH